MENVQIILVHTGTANVVAKVQVVDVDEAVSTCREAAIEYGKKGHSRIHCIDAYTGVDGIATDRVCSYQISPTNPYRNA